LPRVALHIAVSVDGRIDWISPDRGLFYELASRWNEDTTLAGSDTIIKAGGEVAEDDEEAFKPPKRA